MKLHEAAHLNPYIIAEIGVNHEGDVARAKAMIEAAARGGAHAAKFQCYKADLIAAKETSPAYWDTNCEAATSQHALFSRYDGFDAADYEALAHHCRACGVDFLCTPFDLSAVSMLAPLMPAFKIASADITNIALLRAAAQTGKPMIVSTGAASLDEIQAAIDVLEQAGCHDITLLHCVLNYPTPKAHAQMHLLADLQKRFGANYAAGYSDHVPPEPNGDMPALQIAALMGARVLEKHFTDDKKAPGNDHYHAMDEVDLHRFTGQLSHYRTLYGSDAPRDLSLEKAARQHARRRICAARAIMPGEVIGPQHLIALRSDCGIEAAKWDTVIGRTARVQIALNTPLMWGQIDGEQSAD